MKKSEQKFNEEEQLKFEVLHTAFAVGEDSIEEKILDVLLKQFISKNTRLAQEMMRSTGISEKPLELMPSYTNSSTLSMEQ